jgi:hypothetical protein
MFEREASTVGSHPKATEKARVSHHACHPRIPNESILVAHGKVRNTALLLSTCTACGLAGLPAGRRGRCVGRSQPHASSLAASLKPSNPQNTSAPEEQRGSQAKVCRVCLLLLRRSSHACVCAARMAAANSMAPTYTSPTASRLVLNSAATYQTQPSSCNMVTEKTVSRRGWGHATVRLRQKHPRLHAASQGSKLTDSQQILLIHGWTPGLILKQVQARQHRLILLQQWTFWSKGEEYQMLM